MKCRPIWLWWVCGLWGMVISNVVMEMVANAVVAVNAVTEGVVIVGMWLLWLLWLRLL